MTRRKLRYSLVLLVIISVLNFSPAFACTIVSARASNGQVWTCNNEDGPLHVANFINVFPRSGKMKYGYFTLSYFSPKAGEGGGMQGGMNEAGLTFDFNSIDYVKGFNPKTKKAFAAGDDQILPNILGTMSTVEEVVAFFEEYWFQSGFRSAQMHVADKQGKFAIISASGIQIAEKGKPMVSTNFDICGKQDGSTCWRYPKAMALLNQNDASLKTMMAICRETKQGASTLYSNIQNLTTGDIWFFSNHDPKVTIKTNIAKLLAKGRKSYTFSNLKSLNKEQPVSKSVSAPTRVALTDAVKEKYSGKYQNEFTGPLTVAPHPDGIKLVTGDGTVNIGQAVADDTFFFANENGKIKFKTDPKTKQMILTYSEDGFWSFDALREEK